MLKNQNLTKSKDSNIIGNLLAEIRNGKKLNNSKDEKKDID
jgi:hypothetical protein